LDRELERKGGTGRGVEVVAIAGWPKRSLSDISKVGFGLDVAGRFGLLALLE
jgi:hypothetical protein